MTRTRSLCLSFDEPRGEQITGSLADEEGNDWSFSCWLELLTAIDRVLACESAGAQPAGRLAKTSSVAKAR